MRYSKHKLSAVNMYYLPITSTSPQRPLFSVPKVDYRCGEVRLYYYQLNLLIRWNSKRKKWDYSIRGKTKQNHWSLTWNNSSNVFQVAFHFGLSCPSKAEEAHS